MLNKVEQKDGRANGAHEISNEGKRLIEQYGALYSVAESENVFVRQECRPFDLMNSGKSKAFDVTARNCRAADYIEKKIRQEQNKRFFRKMLLEDIGAGIFATCGIVLMLAIAYGLLFGNL